MDSKIDSTFIKAERRKRGWSQEQLAVAAGVAIRTVQRIESSGTASGESAKCLAAVFEVPLDRLYVEPRKAFSVRSRLWAGAATACVLLASSLFLIPRANAHDIAMALVVETDTTGLSRMNLEVPSGRQTEIKLEKDLRLLLTPTRQPDGTILLAAELYDWDGGEFKLARKPRLLMRQGVEVRLQLGLANGRSVRISVVSRAI